MAHNGIPPDDDEETVRFRFKAEDEELAQPLRNHLLRLLRYGRKDGPSMQDIAEKLGMTQDAARRTLYQNKTVGYVSMTRAIIGAGMTPNEAAKFIGLIPPPARLEGQRREFDPRLVAVMEDIMELPPADREFDIAHIESFVEASRRQREKTRPERKKRRPATKAEN